MGPSNIALVRLFQADQKLREVQERLDAATKNVRVQERRVADLGERLRLSQQKLREQQSQGHNFDLELKTREERIERLRTQQQQANNAKEYQAFLVEINTEKVDRAKAEEASLKSMEAVEKTQAESKELSGQLDAEKAKLTALQAEIGARVTALTAERDTVRPLREQAASAVPPRIRDTFDRLSERYEGEALSAIAKPDRRREEYLCTACNMDLVTDVYNRLHSRDELVYCPSCGRMLYIPEDLPVEQAVHKPKVRKEPKVKAKGTIGAMANRQSSAADVLRSMQVEEDDDAVESPADPAPAPEASDPATPASEPG